MWECLDPCKEILIRCCVPIYSNNLLVNKYNILVTPDTDRHVDKKKSLEVLFPVTYFKKKI